MRPILDYYPKHLVGLAGKDSVGQRRAGEIYSEHDFMSLSMWELLREEAGSRRRVEMNREGLYAIIPEVHRRYRHPGSLVMLAIARWNRQRENYAGGLAILDVSVASEAWYLKQLGGKVGFMDAPNTLCYSRIQRPTQERVRFGVKLPRYYSFEEFKTQVAEDYEGRPDNSDYPRLKDIDDMKDFGIVNNSSISKLRSGLEAALNLEPLT